MSDVEKFKPGHCEDCVHENAPEPFFKAPCKGCLGTWGTDLEKPNFVPKPEFILEDEGVIPRCARCIYCRRGIQRLECKYCTASLGPSTGNYFEPHTGTSPEVFEVSAPVESIKPVTLEENGMSRVITNAMQLFRAGVLRDGDTVVFRNARFCVNLDHLSHAEYSNDAVFTSLGMDEHEKYLLAELAYGYSTGCGVWPCYKDDDYAAATRLCCMLYGLLAARQVEEHDAKVHELSELKVMLESYQQDEDDAAIALAEAQRNYESEKSAREVLEADIELLEKELSK